MKAIKAIYTLLTQSTEVTATVYPSRILEGATLPAVVLTQISRVGNDTSSSYSKSDVSRVQIDCVGSTATDAFNLAEAVRSAMSAQLPTIFQGVLVQNIAFDDEQIIYDDTYGTQGATMVSQDYLVMFANATFSIGSVLTEEGDFLLLESGDEILL
jgi:hypothetical protein